VETTLGVAFAARLSLAAAADQRIWVLDGDLADSDGAGVFADAHPDRFLNAGIAEQAMVSAAAGMAACRALPFVFSFAAFLCYRAYDQIRTCVSQTGLPVTLIGSHAGGCGSRNGKTHVALTDIALMSVLPRFEIWAPGDRRDATAAAAHALGVGGPSYVRLPRRLVAALPAGDSLNRWLGRPTRIALCASGLATAWALEVQALLRERGVEVGVLHLPHLWGAAGPTWRGLLDSSVAVMVIDDHSVAGGTGELLRRGGFKGEVDVAGWPPDWSGQSGAEDDLRRLAGLDAPSLVTRFCRLLEKYDRPPRTAGRIESIVGAASKE